MPRKKTIRPSTMSRATRPRPLNDAELDDAVLEAMQRPDFVRALRRQLIRTALRVKARAKGKTSASSQGQPTIGADRYPGESLIAADIAQILYFQVRRDIVERITRELEKEEEAMTAKVKRRRRRSDDGFVGDPKPDDPDFHRQLLERWVPDADVRERGLRQLVERYLEKHRREFLAWHLLQAATERLDGKTREKLVAIIADVEQGFPRGWRPSRQRIVVLAPDRSSNRMTEPTSRKPRRKP